MFSVRMTCSLNHQKATSDSYRSTDSAFLSRTIRSFGFPQSGCHQPVKTAVTKLRENISDVVGIILYGSVARGDADRRSDIDLWMLTRSGRAESQREANAIARDLEDMEFDGDRYAYDIDVEAIQAIPAYTDDIREIIVSGIPVYKTSDFETVENLLREEGAANE